MEQPVTKVESAREWFAVLATLAMSAMAAGTAGVLWLGGWSPGTERLRIGFLGTALMVLLGLVGLGVSWLWKMQYRSLDIRAGMIELSLKAQGNPAA